MGRLIDGDELAINLGITNFDCEKCGLKGVYGCQRGREFAYACAIIEDAPTVPRWIPCSERLPTESDDYLCTYGSLSGWFVDISIYEAEKKEFGFYSENEHGEDVWYPVTNVVAWMPLPKPWRAES